MHFEKAPSIDFDRLNGYSMTSGDSTKDDDIDDEIDDDIDEEPKNAKEKEEIDNALAKAATFVYIFFQLCYFYFIDIFKRAVYLTNLHHQNDKLKNNNNKVSTVESLHQDRYKKFFADSFVPRLVRSEENYPEQIIEEQQQIKTTTTAESYVEPQSITVVSGKPVETRYSTTVFEVRNQNLNSILDEIVDEIRRCRLDAEEENEFLACGEIVWSVPTRLRNYPAEIRLRNEITDCLRINNLRLLDRVRLSSEGRRAARGRQFGCDGVVEETVEKRGSHCSGLYRKYYLDLLDTAHADAQLEHEPVWRFDQKKKSPDENPTIGSVDDTVFVKLNFIYLRF